MRARDGGEWRMRARDDGRGVENESEGWRMRRGVEWRMRARDGMRARGGEWRMRARDGEGSGE